MTQNGARTRIDLAEQPGLVAGASQPKFQAADSGKQASHTKRGTRRLHVGPKTNQRRRR